MKKTAVVLASVLLAACNSAHKAEAPLASQSGAGDPAQLVAARADLGNLNAEIQKLEAKSDYFDFDKFVVKPEFEDILRMEAEFIKDHKQDFVTLEGNADERGSNRYNLQLGGKRAMAVEQKLVMLGVPQSRIKVVSLGKEKPRLTCHEEKCWKENRRVDFVHQLD